MKHLDMAGQPCPIPVVRARGALAAGEDVVTVDVDNEVAVQNLRKMAAGEGYAFSSAPMAGGLFRVTLGAGSADPAVSVVPAAPAAPDIGRMAGGAALLIGRQRMGDGDAELGAMLMKGFLFSQTELSDPPADAIFVNGGAWLTSEGAATVPDLLALEARGARIWTCGTCANFYGIQDRLAVGRLTDMMHIARMLSEAGRVVSL